MSLGSLSTIRPENKVALAAAMLGLCVSLICYCIALFNHDVSDWMLVVWPSMIMLLAIFHPGLIVLVGVTMSVLVNVALYAAIGRVSATLVLLATRRKSRGRV